MIEICLGAVLDLAFRVVCRVFCDGLCNCICNKDDSEKPIINSDEFKKVIW